MTKSKILLIFIAVIVIAGAGWVWRTKTNKRSAGQSMRTVAVTEGPIQASIDAMGAVTPLNRVEIKPPIQGRIDMLLAEEGDNVAEGQILAWMSSSDRAAILDAARAAGPEEVKRWENTYKPTPIVAPLSGVIILRNIVKGQTVDAGTIVYAMSDQLIVTAQVDESDIGKIHKGMPVKITLDSYPDKPVKGSVFDMLYEGKNVSNVITYGVKVRPVKVPAFFRSQMTANVSFISDQKNNALLIPIAAVRESGSGGKMVLVPGEKGMPVPRDITTGLESGDQVEVVSGLESGDNIIIASGKYVPQQGLQSNPLVFGGRRNSNASQNRGQGRAR